MDLSIPTLNLVMFVAFWAVVLPLAWKLENGWNTRAWIAIAKRILGKG